MPGTVLSVQVWFTCGLVQRVVSFFDHFKDFLPQRDCSPFPLDIAPPYIPQAFQAVACPLCPPGFCMVMSPSSSPLGSTEASPDPLTQDCTLTVQPSTIPCSVSHVTLITSYLTLPFALGSRLSVASSLLERASGSRDLSVLFTVSPKCLIQCLAHRTQ